MTSPPAFAESRAGPSPAAFAAAVFASAALVFLLEPMIARLLLPRLGGGPSVWNTSMAFFQAALLVGYGYAHLLQKAGSVRRQALIHAAALVLAAAALPLRVDGRFGTPDWAHPAPWLLGVLAVAVGAPFAVLSATAPLLQAWRARLTDEGAGEVYSLYAASNLGSLLALIAYPLLEPLLPLHVQTSAWGAGYLAFTIGMAGLSLRLGRRAQGATAILSPPAGSPVGWSDRLTWLALAALPSSLMLGVTTHLVTDIASAPFLWVGPLALYLLSFVIAFQPRPAIPSGVTLLVQAITVVAAAGLLPFRTEAFLLQLALHQAAFFFTALMCHQTLVARRPPASRLTEFYLWVALGGVVGGVFNALVAPLIFSNVWEYPAALALSALVRPWGRTATPLGAWMLLILAGAAALASPAAAVTAHDHGLLVRLLLGAAMLAAFLLRGRGLLMFAALSVLLMAGYAVSGLTDLSHNWRSFFGVLHISETQVPALGGPVRMLSNGTTLHGAQALSPAWRCRPLVYYAPETPIGQVFTTVAAQGGALSLGAVGLGTGSVAAYARPGDRLTFFEIDPLVVRLATDAHHFTYTTACARGEVRFLLGDARLTLAGEPDASFDVLLIDAFSSDSVPTHLLTVEALRTYLRKIRPNGVIILHLSNRNLELRSPALAAARAAGGAALLQRHDAAEDAPMLWESAEDAVIVARNARALAPFAADPRWTGASGRRTRAWTDDYVNLAGALFARQREIWAYRFGGSSPTIDTRSP